MELLQQNGDAEPELPITEVTRGDEYSIRNVIFLISFLDTPMKNETFYNESGIGPICLE